MSSWGAALAIFSVVGCGSSGGSGTGGAGGAAKGGNGGHAGAGLGGKGGNGLAGNGGGAAGNPGVGGAAGAAGSAGGSAGGAAGGTAGGGGGAAGGKAGAGGGGGTATGGTAGNAGGAGGTAQTGDFSFSTGTTTALSLPPGGNQTIAITINRDAATPTFTSSIMFGLTGTGVTGTFNPNPATAGSTSLMLAVASTATPGSTTVHITGTAAGKTHTVDVPLTVTAPATTLLVDFDNSDNNADPTNTSADPSPSDTLFPTLLQGENIVFNTFVVPTSTTAPTTPTTQVLAPYSTLVWYNGGGGDGSSIQNLSGTQEAIVKSWLDQGGKTMLIFSEQLFYALGSQHWTTPETDAFLSDYIGAQGDSVDGLQSMPYTATGAAGTPFENEVFQVIHNMDNTPIFTTDDAVNPKTGTDVLVTVMEDVDGSGIQAVPVVVGRKQVGAAGTSTVVYVGMAVENINMTAANNNTAAQFFHAVLKYAGLK